MTICFDWGGISYRVDACVLEDEGVVEDITTVEAVATDGEYVQLEVEREDFLEQMQDVLNEALEKTLQERELDYAEMKMDMEREERE